MKTNAVISALILVLVAVDSAKGDIDYYSSTLRTQELLQTHSQIVRIFSLYSTALSEAATLLNKFLSQAELSSVAEPWDTDGDPLRTFRLIKRTSKDMDNIIIAIRKLRALDPLLEVDNFRVQQYLPNDDDFKGIVQAILRIQRTYHLQAADIARGKLVKDTQLSVNLTASDCLYIAKESEAIHKTRHGKKTQVEAPQWYQTGLDLFGESSPDPGLEDQLQSGLKNVNPENETYPFLPDEYTDSRYNDSMLTVRPGTITAIEELRLFRRLCRGEKLRSPSLDAKCSCYLKQGPHPYLKLRPLKIEVRNLDPFMGVLHDIIGDQEIDNIKTQGSPYLVPSTVVGPEALSVKSHVRVSATSWLGDYHLPNLKGHLETLTGLYASVYNREAEELQVLNYGVGGHYSVHHDFFEDERADNFSLASGGRVATLMIYLSDVEAGGATVFPNMGITVFPQKGSAAFWWNLRHSGEGEYRTLHAACPVIYGTKWVCNKWFRAHPQMFRFPCGPKIDSGPNML